MFTNRPKRQADHIDSKSDDSDSDSEDPDSDYSDSSDSSDEESTDDQARGNCICLTTTRRYLEMDNGLTFC